jgi:hypothetical protein
MLISYSSFLFPFLDLVFIAFFKYCSNRSTRGVGVDRKEGGSLKEWIGKWGWGKLKLSSVASKTMSLGFKSYPRT